MSVLELDFRQIVDFSADAMVAADRTDRVAYINHAAERLFGWTRSELVGRSLTVLMPERLRPIHLEGFARFLRTGKGRLMGRPIRVPALHRSGEEIDVELTISALQHLGAPLFVASFRDLRIRIELERQLLGQQRAQAQFEVMRALVEVNHSAKDAMPHVLKAMGRALGWDVGLFWEEDKSVHELRVSSAWASEPSFEPFIRGSEAISYSSGMAVVGQVWKANKPAWITDTRVNSRYLRAGLAAQVGLVGVFLCPVRVEGKVSGMLEFLSREPLVPDKGLTKTMEPLAFEIGQFIAKLRIDEELREGRERLRLATEATGLGTWDFDPLRRWLTFDARSREIFRFSPEERLNRRSILARIHPEDRTRIQALNQDALEAHQSSSYRADFRIGTDGGERWIEAHGRTLVDKSGKVSRMVGTVLDVTERRRAEDAASFLSQTSAHLSASLDYQETLKKVANLVVPRLGEWCFIHLMDPLRVLVHHADPQRAKWAGDLASRYPLNPNVRFGPMEVIQTGKPELLPRVEEEFLVGFARDADHLSLLREVVAGRSVVIVPLTARGRTFGALSVISARSAPPYADSDLSFVASLAGRAAYAVDNARLYQEAQQAISARDEFLSIASHELKTPLTPLQLQVQIIERQLPGLVKEEEVHAWLEKRLQMIHRQGDRLGRLVSELLDISRLVGGRLKLQLEPVDLSGIVAAVVDGFREQGELARVESEVRLNLKEAIGLWDRLRVEQVVTNLISNALKYGEGKVIEISCSADGENAQLMVKDQGIGIDPESRERIFGRFERAVSARHYAGLGLGLYIVRQVVEALGGRVGVESALGQGSTFTVTLPLQGPPRHEEEKPEVSPLH